ncbi:MAG: hypothetical protein A3B99_03970 [Candidatus Yanofskybacteria bacterium RIFCSPHIGHO2_02_FULL_44_12b]|uniref:Gluconeogenesis factor n=2 Tax=Candidatus Yanofskyibacteriota TaxID=1752733 RepID=A0A1F8GN22_9BACT|nr:MAG: hypothetical protein A2659_00870 [Candidatus Yanofskybacteria bacterium RIFCSPHIGHO2_01_FULL_44_24]OGN15675.1 MAG: hypothetical protein A3B99_03970 [Candidatus Yanofskybacteria bacterium RIFCSPHIGHO2_02_FULL_44_12b]OGN26731.1 MAG: hypothetical protein A2925_04055 [Candidatus Yanofskybacteria bacterium RIFCSPLOWO2_01_FULL_44_22]
MNSLSEAKKIKIVCFGGGTGMPSLLSGLKHNPWLDIAAVVNMFDTGGSSGELRDRFGILPPGDILKCLLALSEDDAVARKILLKRISHNSYPGHTGGNLLLLGLEKVYANYQEAVDSLAQILSVKGRVLPVTLADATLCGKFKDKTVYKGETSIDVGIFEGREVDELFLEPAVKASSQALKAIRDADVMCIGPGSFYTSVLPNFLPVGIKEAIKKSKAPIIFTSNLLTEGMGMRGFTLDKIVKVLERYTGRRINAAIANKKLPSRDVLDKYAQERKHPIVIKNKIKGTKLIRADLWIDTAIARHDSMRLSNLIFGTIHRLLKK